MATEEDIEAMRAGIKAAAFRMRPGQNIMMPRLVRWRRGSDPSRFHNMKNKASPSDGRMVNDRN